MNALTLFDIAKADGIARVEDHADETWKEAAFAAVLTAAAEYDDFTADEVWELIGDYATTHEPSAMGPVFLRACRGGFIVKTGVLRPSSSPRRHRDLTVWAAA